MIILKPRKRQGFTLSLEDAFFKKQRGGDQFQPSLSHFTVNSFQPSVVFHVETSHVFCS